MDNNNSVVQSIYGSSGIDHSSSTAAGKAEASLGGYCAPQQTNESFSAYQTRTQAFNDANNSSGN
jgi:hypothetical protein